MGTITEDMRRVVGQQKLGFVASVGSDGSPNLSPKGTFLVRDDDHIMCGELRSPNTLKNLKHCAIVEVNFVDPLARKGYRFKGPARFVERDSAEFDELLPAFHEWGDLCHHFRGIIDILVDVARALESPAYDHGADETALRAEWLGYYTRLNR